MNGYFKGKLLSAYEISQASPGAPELTTQELRRCIFNGSCEYSVSSSE
jgi:hypothetical protein